FHTAPDHLCALATPEPKFRCWRRPIPGEKVARPMPDSWQWLNPHGAGWNDAYSRSDRVGPVHVGGTFSCLQATKGSGLFCLGDDQFGQLGGSTGAPKPDSAPADPVFLQNV